MHPQPALAPFEEIRTQLHLQFTDTLRERFGNPSLSVTALNRKVLDGIRIHWEASPHRRLKHWNWKALHRDVVYARARFEAAVMDDEVPILVVIGKLSKDGKFLGVPRLEAHPGIHALKGHAAEIAIDMAFAFTKAIGAKELRIQDPLEELYGYYEALGLTPVSGPGSELYFALAV